MLSAQKQISLTCRPWHLNPATGTAAMIWFIYTYKAASCLPHYGKAFYPRDCAIGLGVSSSPPNTEKEHSENSHRQSSMSSSCSVSGTTVGEMEPEPDRVAPGLWDEAAAADAFRDMCALHLCMNRIHRFSPGVAGSDLLRDGDRCASLGHWSLLAGRHVDASSVSSSALHSVCRCGPANLIDVLVGDFAVDVNARDSGGWTALHTAAVRGSEDTVARLLALGARDITTNDGVHASALRPDLCGIVASCSNYTSTRISHAPQQEHAVADPSYLTRQQMIIEQRDAPTETVCRDVCAAAGKVRDDSEGATLTALWSDKWEDRCEILTSAAWAGRYSLCRVALELGANVNDSVSNGIIPLFHACEKGHIDCANLLLDHDSDIDAANRFGETPLYIACDRGHVDCTRLLIERGAQVDKAAKLGRTPLHQSCQNGHIACARLLLEHGASINVSTTSGSTPLAVACASGRTNCVRFLLSCGADTSVANFLGETALHVACQEGHADCAHLLLDNGACDRTAAMPPLWAASAVGDADKCRFLLGQGAEVDQWDVSEQSPLHIACLNGHEQCARQLLSRGARDDEFPLWVACAVGDVDRARLLLLDHAEVDDCGGMYGIRPLFIACKNGHTECARLLLDHGANSERTNSLGESPLFAACEKGHSKCVRMLLDRGAIVDSERYDHDTCLTGACRSGSEDCVRLLLDCGAAIEHPNMSGERPLFVACERGHEAVVRLLLRHGAEVDQGNHSGETPLWIACVHGHVVCATLLLDYGACVDAVDERGQRPLHGVCRAIIDLQRPRHEAFETTRACALLLLAAGADPTRKDWYGRTPAALARSWATPDLSLTDAVELAERDLPAALQRLQHLVESTNAGQTVIPNRRETLSGVSRRRKSDIHLTHTCRPQRMSWCLGNG